MKLSTWHKNLGDEVERYLPLMHETYDKIYCSSVFTYSDKSMVRDDMELGGTGFDINKKLPFCINKCKPDYALYPEFRQAIGFITRGCIRKCRFCFVPEKEGNIHPCANIENIVAGRKEVILMDNNILAHSHGIKNLERITKMKIKIDINQGLDSRLIDNGIAKTLSKIKWIRFIRMACDNESMIVPLRRAVRRLKENDILPYRVFVYVLIDSVQEAKHRIDSIRDMGVDIFAQPFRPPNGSEPGIEIKRFARWVNHKAIFKTVPWENYR